MNTHAQIKDCFGDYRWRLSNLYYITDKQGKRVKFELNWAQEEFLNEMWTMNCILKARQLGFTTFIQLFMLDQCIFNSNKNAGTIAHTLNDAVAIFRTKIKYPYDNLPVGITNKVRRLKNSATELVLSNNSSIRVGVSMRSGTLNFLHISELGKISAKFPEKAREIRTGALNTTEAGQWVTIESTAEGQDGDFYTICQTAEGKHNTGEQLSELDFKFHFFPWWRESGYRINPTNVVVSAYLQEYFKELQDAYGIVLDARQRAWYAKKSESQLTDMWREYPSTPQEAFAAAVEGAYYGTLISQAEKAGRIGAFPAAAGVPVHTAWDIGRSDHTAIWFYQNIGNERRMVYFYQNCGEGMPFYASKVHELYEQHGWSRDESKDHVPHDARVTEWGSNKSRLEQMRDAKLFPVIPTALSLHDGINACRTVIPRCTFDKEGCAEGIIVLKNYRKQWNKDRGCWSSTPFHNKYSHGADAFRTFACSEREQVVIETEDDTTTAPTGIVIADIVKQHKRHSAKERRTR